MGRVADWLIGPVPVESGSAAVTSVAKRPRTRPEPTHKQREREKQHENSLSALNAAMLAIPVGRVGKAIVGPLLGAAGGLALHGESKAALETAAMSAGPKVAAPVVAALIADAGDAEAKLIDQLRGAHDLLLGGYMRGDLRQAVSGARRLDRAAAKAGHEIGPYVNEGEQSGVYELADSPDLVAKLTYNRPHLDYGQLTTDQIAQAHLMGKAGTHRGGPVYVPNPELLDVPSEALTVPHSGSEDVKFFRMPGGVQDTVRLEFFDRAEHDLLNAVERGVVSYGEAARILERLAVRLASEGYDTSDLAARNVGLFKNARRVSGAPDTFKYRMLDVGLIDRPGNVDPETMLAGARKLWVEGGYSDPGLAAFGKAGWTRDVLRGGTTTSSGVPVAGH